MVFKRQERLSLLANNFVTRCDFTVSFLCDTLASNRGVRVDNNNRPKWIECFLLQTNNDIEQRQDAMQGTREK
jgi:hypothetical protein